MRAIGTPSASLRPIIMSSMSCWSGAIVSRGSSPWPPLLDGGEPALRLAERAGRELPAVHGDPAMGAGADAGIVAIAPVDEIVPQLLARSGMVRDLVGGKARVAQDRLRRLEKLAGQVLVRHGERAGRVQGVEAGAGLDGELIGRKMAAHMAERSAQLRLPGGHRSGPAARR